MYIYVKYIHIYIYIYIYNLYAFAFLWYQSGKAGSFFHLIQYSIEISPHVGASINFHYFWQRRFIMNNC